MTDFPLIRGRVMRVTRLNGCGEPVLGPDSVVTSDGFVSIALTSQIDQGDTIERTKANGKKCINDVPAPQFTGFAVEVTFCGVSPELWNIMSGQEVVLDPQDETNAIGIRLNSKVDLDAFAFALEAWSNVPGDTCSGSAGTFGYTVIPFLKGGVLSDFTIQNDAVDFVITGANTKDGNGWGVGPFDVVEDEDGTAAPLFTALDGDDFLHLQTTGIVPPEPAEGATALGVPVTTFTAGIPATLIPTNSYAPATLAELTALHPLAAPTTAWTAGQYVLLRDGTKAHWNATAWVANAA